jgi:hypothetical protein
VTTTTIEPDIIEVPEEQDEEDHVCHIVCSGKLRRWPGPPAELKAYCGTDVGGMRQVGPNDPSPVCTMCVMEMGEDWCYFCTRVRRCKGETP